MSAQHIDWPVPVVSPEYVFTSFEEAISMANHLRSEGWVVSINAEINADDVLLYTVSTMTTDALSALLKEAQ